MSYNPFFSVMLALGVAGRAAIGTDGRRVVTGATGMTVVKLASPVSALPPGDVRRGRVDGRESLMVVDERDRARRSRRVAIAGAPRRRRMVRRSRAAASAARRARGRCPARLEGAHRRRFPPVARTNGVVLAALDLSGEARLRTFGKFR